MNISGKTKLTGLLGSPVSHSISPAMHNEAFRILGLDYVYLAFDVGPEKLKVAVDGLKAIGIRGFNLTMPDKVPMIELVDELTPAARLAGACNTVINNDGHLIGHTTDGIGYMRSCQDAGHNIIGEKMTILGAGGAATAIITQAALDGVSAIDIFRRNRPDAFAQTEAFAKMVTEHTGCTISVFDIADEAQLKSSLESSRILTNATNVGMAPDEDRSPIRNASFFHPELIVSDIIYNPRQTKLMSMAADFGCPTFNGMYMLLYQGAAAFECWTGMEMPVAQIKENYFKA
ncbi:MAG: shikimate dehydrogenase [Eubacterium sp.]|nr:shikimate dehydrogenase [Eubacterium sp.]